MNIDDDPNNSELVHVLRELKQAAEAITNEMTNEVTADTKNADNFSACLFDAFEVYAKKENDEANFSDSIRKALAPLQGHAPEIFCTGNFLSQYLSNVLPTFDAQLEDTEKLRRCLIDLAAKTPCFNYSLETIPSANNPNKEGNKKRKKSPKRTPTKQEMKRACCLEQFMHFSIEFESAEIHEISIDNLTSRKPNGFIRLAIQAYLHESFKNLRFTPDSDSHEISQINSIWNAYEPKMSLFGYDAKDSTKLQDFTISKLSTDNNDSDKKELIFGESKSISSELPSKEMLRKNMSFKYAAYGFADRVAKHTYESNEFDTTDLLNSIKSVKHETDKKVTNPTSDIVKSLFIGWNDVNSEGERTTDEKDWDEKMKDYCLDCVKLWNLNNNPESARTDNANRNAAAQLFAATIQACVASISLKSKYTMMMNGRICWFIVLRCEGGRCKIGISDGFWVGSRAWFLRLLKILHERVKGSGNSFEGDSTDISSWDGSPSKNNSKDNSTMTDEEQMKFQIALSAYNGATVNEVEYLGADGDVVVPYLHQLDKVMMKSEIIGTGRSGIVKKVHWDRKNICAAMKCYHMYDEEDGEYLDHITVYEHELNVMMALKSLWGKLIPALLFHNPWPTCPCIGMEYGESIEEWSEEDKAAKDECVEKLRENGFVQEDLSDDNFVRLSNGKIVMIDFESMTPISND